MSPIPTIAASARRVLARRPWIQWMLILTLATAVAISVDGRLSQIDARRDSWGATRSVLVASGPIEVGDVLHVRRRDLPIAVVPEGAIDETQGLVARQRIGVGEIVTDVDVSAKAGPRAMTPPGWLAVPVIESPRSGAIVGDRVQVASDGFVVSTEAIVVDSFDDVTVLAVPAAEAPLLPTASLSGSLTLLLEP